jgi:hypothetical protein
MSEKMLSNVFHKFKTEDETLPSPALPWKIATVAPMQEAGSEERRQKKL